MQVTRCLPENYPDKCEKTHLIWLANVQIKNHISQ
jgi:hypothetical protein